MKKCRLTLVLSLLIFVAGNSFAAEDMRKKNAIALVKATMEVRDFDKARIDMAKLSFTATLNTMPESEKKQKIVAIIEDVIVKIFKELSPKLKTDTIEITANIYAKYYTEEELEALTIFFNTELGRKFTITQQIISLELRENLRPLNIIASQKLQIEIDKSLIKANLK